MSDESSGSPLPDVPVVNLPTVFALRNRLMTQVFDEFVGVPLEGTAFLTLVERVRQALPGGVEALPVSHSLRYLSGREPDEAALREAAWRLAGNLARLRQGLPAAPWTRQTVPEWVPVQVVANRYAIQRRPDQKFGRSGRTLRFAVLAGTPCPMRVTQWWSNEKLDVVAYHVGFKRRPPMFKADQAEFTSLRFMVLLDPARCGREPGFFHVACPASFLDYNRALIKKRRRIGFSCPAGYDHQCHQCHLGVRSCEAACHPADFEERACPACGRTWWFDTDPEFVNDNCVNCQPLVSAGISVKREATDEPAEPPVS